MIKILKSSYWSFPHENGIRNVNFSIGFLIKRFLTNVRGVIQVDPFSNMAAMQGFALLPWPQHLRSDIRIHSSSESRPVAQSAAHALPAGGRVRLRLGAAHCVGRSPLRDCGLGGVELVLLRCAL